MILNVALTIVFAPEMDAENGPRWLYYRYACVHSCGGSGCLIDYSWGVWLALLQDYGFIRPLTTWMANKPVVPVHQAHLENYLIMDATLSTHHLQPYCKQQHLAWVTRLQA